MRELTAAELRDARPAGPRPKAPRDPRLDVLRGLALVTIFINHVPGNAYEAWTLREFGFSDAAEGFVLMSGVSAGLAYGMGFRPGAALLPSLGRVWRRAWTLYLAHLLVTFMAIAIAAGLALWAGIPGLLHLNGIDGLYRTPLQTLVALPLLLDQLGYANILPLYCVLLLATPALLWAAWRAPRALLAGSVALWVVSGLLALNVPTWPVPRGWQFSPFSWQILFVIGLLTGLNLKQGRRLVPQSGALLALALGFLALALAWRLVPSFGHLMDSGLAALQQAGVPWLFTSHQKVWETAPRLLHALALAYALSALPWVRTACGSRLMAPLALLGRQALPVFVLGSILAFLLQGLKTATGQHIGLDSLMLGGGLALQFALAWARDRWPG